jgi:hypothetical protein
MKKILFLIALTLSLTSCVNKSTDNVPDVNIDETMCIQYTDKLYRKLTPVQFEYNGHKYIAFMGYESHSTVHDPDCDCNNNNKY